jgi:hypothetical protein
LANPRTALGGENSWQSHPRPSLFSNELDNDFVITDIQQFIGKGLQIPEKVLDIFRAISSNFD